MALRTPQSTLIVTLALELLGVGLFSLLAGASEEAGTIVILLMVGFWLIFLVSNANIIAGLGNAFRQLAVNPGNNAGEGGN